MMISRITAVARRPGAQKMIRYTMVSALCVVIAQVVLFGLQVGASMNEGLANVVAFAVSTIPSYELNRRWAWGRTGKGHLWKEVVPFWVLSFVGFALSEAAVVAAGAWARHHRFSHVGRSTLVNAAALTALGVLWLGKFALFNRLLFSSPDAARQPVLDTHP